MTLSGFVASFSQDRKISDMGPSAGPAGRRADTELEGCLLRFGDVTDQVGIKRSVSPGKSQKLMLISYFMKIVYSVHSISF
jgi:hypothetical protein